MLKDILLVLTSLLLFLDPVTPLQAFGYSIALCGLVYYKLGAEKIKQHLSEAETAWSKFKAESPGIAKLAIAVVGLITLYLVASLLL